MKDTESASIAIIIPHYNDLDRLDRCLRALSACDGISNADVVVIDNGSDADLVPLQMRHPSIRFIIEYARGAAAARNRGVRETFAPMLFFLDSDCVPKRNWIIAGLRSLKCFDIVGGSIELFDETPLPRSGAQAFESVFAFNQRQYVEKKGFSASANLLTWRHVFETVGGFRSEISEDVDWCHRAVKKGFLLGYDEHVKVAHPTRTSMADLERKWRRMTRERFALEVRQPYGRLRWIMRAGLVLCSPMIDFWRVLFSKSLHGPTEIGRGIYVLFHLRIMRALWMVQQALSLDSTKALRQKKEGAL
ncbi:glycosyltransferase family 2 protein [Microvirga sp. 17 mud 1-3]|uniref:glycosyltransferase family 2 protein n=1 Tax=Microvirga sp. 17 mud 1-3 TaxID=2082949 RepID=UPI000D6C1998|nr:glycosyltransferase [Microvirga sp. 17 mud 1-3]AWM85704.1 glycosyltransferase [Microvirga sp. 17 mud 1-3]